MRKIEQNECRKIQMSILDEIQRICKENNLNYSLAYGTLLGAIRHKGYIPWDDDIDIFLFREDYDKLMALLKDPNVKKQEWFSLLDDSVKDYYYPFAKAYDNRTHVKMDRHKGEMGIWVDIFPLDSLPQTRFLEKPFVLYCSFLRVICLALSTDFKAKTLDTWTRLYKRFFYVLVSMMGKKRYCRFVQWVFRLFAAKKSNRVASLFFDTKADCIWDRDRLTEFAYYKFENREYMGVKDYDYYLSECYHDYMQLPPEEKRYTHALDVWWKE